MNEREGDGSVETDSVEETVLYLGYGVLMTFLAIVTAVVMGKQTREEWEESVQDARIE